MDTDTAEQAQQAAPPVVGMYAPNHASGHLESTAERLATPDSWRWVPDPSEVAIPTPPPGRDAGPSDRLIKALTELGLHYWR